MDWMDCTYTCTILHAYVSNIYLQCTNQHMYIYYIIYICTIYTGNHTYAWIKYKI